MVVNALPLSMLIVAVPLVGGPSSRLNPIALLIPGILLLVGLILMVVADRAGQIGLAGSGVIFPLVVTLGVFVACLVLQPVTKGAERSPLLFSSLVAMLTLAATLFASCLGRIQQSFATSRPNASSSRQAREDLEARLEAAVQRIKDEKDRSIKLDRQLSNVGSQLATAEQSLQSEQAEVRRLRQEVSELRPRSERLDSLEVWVWPPHESGADSEIAPLYKALEGTCRDAKIGVHGRSLFARLHLISTGDEQEPDRFAEILDLAGRDFYRWLESAGLGSQAGTLEDGFLSFTRTYAGELNLELRPARPGDTVDPDIHHPIGSGLQVIKPRSFYVRRTTDREVIRRALVDV